MAIQNINDLYDRLSEVESFPLLGYKSPEDLQNSLDSMSNEEKNDFFNGIVSPLGVSETDFQGMLKKKERGRTGILSSALGSIDLGSPSVSEPQAIVPTPEVTPVAQTPEVTPIAPAPEMTAVAPESVEVQSTQNIPVSKTPEAIGTQTTETPTTEEEMGIEDYSVSAKGGPLAGPGKPAPFNWQTYLQDFSRQNPNFITTEDWSTGNIYKKVFEKAGFELSSKYGFKNAEELKRAATGGPSVSSFVSVETKPVKLKPAEKPKEYGDVTGGAFEKEKPKVAKPIPTKLDVEEVRVYTDRPVVQFNIDPVAIAEGREFVERRKEKALEEEAKARAEYEKEAMRLKSQPESIYSMLSDVTYKDENGNAQPLDEMTIAAALFNNEQLPLFIKRLEKTRLPGFKAVIGRDNGTLNERNFKDHLIYLGFTDETADQEIANLKQMYLQNLANRKMDNLKNDFLRLSGNNPAMANKRFLDYYNDKAIDLLSEDEKEGYNLAKHIDQLYNLLDKELKKPGTLSAQSDKIESIKRNIQILQEQLNSIRENPNNLYDWRTGQFVNKNITDKRRFNQIQQENKEFQIKYGNQPKDELIKKRDRLIQQREEIFRLMKQDGLDIPEKGTFASAVKAMQISASRTAGTGQIRLADGRYVNAATYENKMNEYNKQLFNVERELYGINRAVMLNEDVALRNEVDRGFLESTGKFLSEAGKSIGRTITPGAQNEDAKADWELRNSYFPTLEQSGFVIAPNLKSAARKDVSELISDSAGTLVEAIFTIATGNALLPAVKSLKWAERFKNVLKNKYGKIGESIFDTSADMVRSGIIFETAGQGFATGVGEQAGQRAFDYLELDKFFKGKAKVLEYLARVITGGSAETVQEYAGQYLQTLADQGVDIQKNFKTAFGRDSETALDQFLQIAITSVLFSGASNYKILRASRTRLNEILTNPGVASQYGVVLDENTKKEIEDVLRVVDDKLNDKTTMRTAEAKTKEISEDYVPASTVTVEPAIEMEAPGGVTPPVAQGAETAAFETGEGPIEAQPTSPLKISTPTGQNENAVVAGEELGSETNVAFLSSIKNERARRRAAELLSSAKDAVQTIKSVLPNAKVVFHSTESFNKKMDEIGGEKGGKANFSIIENPDGTTDIEIQIDAEGADYIDLAHEVTHGVLFAKMFNQEAKAAEIEQVKAQNLSPEETTAKIQEINNKYKTKFSEELVGFKKDLETIVDETTNKRLSDFIKNYEGSEQAEEYLVELAAIMSQEGKQLEQKDPGFITKLLAVINKYVGFIGEKANLKLQKFENAKDVINFFNGVSKAIRKGETLEGVELKPKTEIKPETKSNIIDFVENGKPVKVDLSKLELVPINDPESTEEGMQEFSIESEGRKLGEIAVEYQKDNNNVKIAFSRIFGSDEFIETEEQKQKPLAFWKIGPEIEGVIYRYLKKVFEKIKTNLTKPFQGNFIYDTNQGKGIGKNTYGILAKVVKEEFGKNLISDTTRSEASEALWKSLERDGLAINRGEYYEYILPTKEVGAQPVNAEEVTPATGQITSKARIVDALEKSNETETNKLKSNFIIKKAEDISKKSEYLNCEAFCVRLFNNKSFKEVFDKITPNIRFGGKTETVLPKLQDILKAGDIISFGEKNNPRHYAVYLGGDSVYEVEQWGAKPRTYTVSENLDIYEGVNAIYRDENLNEEIADAYTKAKTDGSNPELVKAVDELVGAQPEVTEQAPEVTEEESQDRITNIRNKARRILIDKTTGDIDVDGQIVVIPDVVKKNANGIIEALSFATKSSIPTNVEFKRELQKRFQSYFAELKKYYGKDFDPKKENETLKRYLVDAYTQETLIAMNSFPDALGWYDAKTKAAMAIMTLIHPELATDPVAEGVFKIGLAITSNGNKVNENFVEADRQYEYYKKNGKFDSSRSVGTQSAAIKKSFEFANQILEQMPAEQFLKFLTSKFKAGDLKYKDAKGKLKNFFSGFLVDAEVFGASIFGPKIGNGFFMNLNGDFSQLTMDRWFMRQYGRLTGKLIDVDPAKVKDSQNRLKDALKKLNAQEKAQLNSLIPAYNKMSPADLAKAINKVSTKADKRAILQSTENLDNLRKAGNTLNKNVLGEIEAPNGGKQRAFIVDVFDAVQKKLRDEYGIDMTIADLQAVNWYPEKALYQTFQSGKTEELGAEETSENEQPDYESAAKRLAKNNYEISDEKINEVLTDRDGNPRFDTGGNQKPGVEHSQVGVDLIKKNILAIKEGRKISEEGFQEPLAFMEDSDPTKQERVNEIATQIVNKARAAQDIKQDYADLSKKNYTLTRIGAELQKKGYTLGQIKKNLPDMAEFWEKSAITDFVNDRKRFGARIKERQVAISKAMEANPGGTYEQYYNNLKDKFGDSELYTAFYYDGATDVQLEELFGSDYRQTIQKAISSNGMNPDILRTLRDDARIRKINDRLDEKNEIFSELQDFVDAQEALAYMAQGMFESGALVAMQTVTDQIRVFNEERAAATAEMETEAIAPGSITKEMIAQKAALDEKIGLMEKIAKGEVPADTLINVSEMLSFSGRMLRMGRSLFKTPDGLADLIIKSLENVKVTGELGGIVKKVKVYNLTENQKGKIKVLAKAYLDLQKKYKDAVKELEDSSIAYTETAFEKHDKAKAEFEKSAKYMREYVGALRAQRKAGKFGDWFTATTALGLLSLRTITVGILGNLENKIAMAGIGIGKYRILNWSRRLSDYIVAKTVNSKTSQFANQATQRGVGSTVDARTYRKLAMNQGKQQILEILKNGSFDSSTSQDQFLLGFAPQDSIKQLGMGLNMAAKLIKNYFSKTEDKMTDEDWAEAFDKMLIDMNRVDANGKPVYALQNNKELQTVSTLLRGLLGSVPAGTGRLIALSGDRSFFKLGYYEFLATYANSMGITDPMEVQRFIRLHSTPGSETDLAARRAGDRRIFAADNMVTKGLSGLRRIITKGEENLYAKRIIAQQKGQTKLQIAERSGLFLAKSLLTVFSPFIRIPSNVINVAMKKAVFPYSFANYLLMNWQLQKKVNEYIKEYDPQLNPNMSPAKLKRMEKARLELFEQQKKTVDASTDFLQAVQVALVTSALVASGAVSPPYGEDDEERNRAIASGKAKIAPGQINWTHFFLWLTGNDVRARTVQKGDVLMSYQNAGIIGLATAWASIIGSKIMSSASKNKTQAGAGEDSYNAVTFGMVTESLTNGITGLSFIQTLGNAANAFKSDQAAETFLINLTKTALTVPTMSYGAFSFVERARGMNLDPIRGYDGKLEGGGLINSRYAVKVWQNITGKSPLTWFGNTVKINGKEVPVSSLASDYYRPQIGPFGEKLYKKSTFWDTKSEDPLDIFLARFQAAIDPFAFNTYEGFVSKVRDYSKDAEYDKGDFVTYNNIVYVAKNNTKGTNPYEDSKNWQTVDNKNSFLDRKQFMIDKKGTERTKQLVDLATMYEWATGERKQFGVLNKIVDNTISFKDNEGELKIYVPAEQMRELQSMLGEAALSAFDEKQIPNLINRIIRIKEEVQDPEKARQEIKKVVQEKLDGSIGVDATRSGGIKDQIVKAQKEIEKTEKYKELQRKAIAHSIEKGLLSEEEYLRIVRSKEFGSFASRYKKENVKFRN